MCFGTSHIKGIFFSMLSNNKILGAFTVFLLTLIFTIVIDSTVVYAATRGTVTGNSVNVRSSGHISSDNQLLQVDHGQALYIHGIYNEFYRVTVADIPNVYIARQFVRIYNTQGTVTSQFAWVYNLPSEEGGASFSLLAEGRPITITGVYGNWYAVEHLGRVAFTQRSNVSTPNFVNLPVVRMGYTIADEIISLAKQYLGARYVWGGNGPNGFDCSGFMVYILRPFDISVHRRSIDMATNGTYVSRNNLQPGDLVFFATAGGGRVSHVGMYIGGGDFIHASSQRTGVMISSMNASYWARTYVTARRVIPT